MVAGTDGAVVLREASKEDCHRSSYNVGFLYIFKISKNHSTHFITL